MIDHEKGPVKALRPSVGAKVPGVQPERESLCKLGTHQLSHPQWHVPNVSIRRAEQSPLAWPWTPGEASRLGQNTAGGVYRRRGIPQAGKGRKRCGNVGAPRPVCTLNGDDESAMNRPNVGAISPFCSIKNKCYKAFTVAHKHARHSLIRRFGAACNTLPDRCRAYRRGYMQHPANELRRILLPRRS
jgi:hypothetical protein